MRLSLESNDLRVLAESGADVNSSDEWGRTALHRVTISGSTRYTIRLLVELGVEVNAREDGGLSVMQRAIKFGCEEVLWTLLELNVEIQVPADCNDYKYARCAKKSLLRAYNSRLSVSFVLETT